MALALLLGKGCLLAGGLGALTSCRTKTVVLPASHTRDSTHVATDHRYDSIYIDRWHIEKLHRGSDPACSFFQTDTLLIHDSVYIEKYRYLAKHDTVTVTRHDSIPYPVEVQSPPRRKPLLPFLISQARTIWRLHREDAPRFYRTCTLGFFLLLLCLILYVFLRIYLRR